MIKLGAEIARWSAVRWFGLSLCLIGASVNMATPLSTGKALGLLAGLCIAWGAALITSRDR